MRITALVENRTHTELNARHGLSLYIETGRHTILFDLGPDGTLFDNARKRKIDLTQIDTVIISHGHMDHGGALERFLRINSKAKIYVQRTAFDPHYSKFLFLKVNVGISSKLREHPQIILVDGDFRIDNELELFTVTERRKYYSSANDSLLSQNGTDNFMHEQNLIIHGTNTALIMGCGHTGVINILDRAQSFSPAVCVGGYHLFNPLTRKTVPDSLLGDICRELKKYPDMQFYTCHCTGTEAYDYFAKRLPNMHYLSCGETIGS